MGIFSALLGEQNRLRLLPLLGRLFGLLPVCGGFLLVFSWVVV